MAQTLNCQVGDLPFKYLGIKVGKKLLRSGEWSYLVEKIKKRIGKWKNRKISFAGRVTLLRSVLLSIPIYHLSFSVLNKKVLSQLRTIMSQFLWGGSLEERKIHWIKWEEICRDPAIGGLGIKDLEWFNKALMSKWLWRFLTEKEALWARVIRACQGNIGWDNNGFCMERKKVNRSGWWKKVLSLSRGDNGKWLKENMVPKIGAGDSFSFWHQNWIGEGCLKELFPRLFNISNNQGGGIKEMGEWSEGKWKWNLGWKREVRGREEDSVQALMLLLREVEMCAGKADGWRWKPDKNGFFSVKSAYSTLSSAAGSKQHLAVGREFSYIWKAIAPFKSKTTAWRLLKGRMATCENLLRRQIPISGPETECIFCKMVTESSQHLFLQCPRSAEVWSDLLRWIGRQTVLHSKVLNHFLAFRSLGDKKDSPLLSGIWICIVWSLWKERNECKFSQGKWNKDRLVADIKSRIWGWKMVFKSSSSTMDFRSWFSTDNLLQ